jgi:16S rRNA U516 pseudouridylate synthase RsuA-like enzyme
MISLATLKSNADQNVQKEFETRETHTTVYAVNLREGKKRQLRSSNYVC